MKCKSCSELIPPKFAHSIKTNICPFCGEGIMDELLQKVLTNLQIIMKEAEPFMIEVEEWFAANYSFCKGNKSSNLHAEIGDDDFSEEAIRKQAEIAKATADFQKRSGVKTSNMKALVEKIQSGKGAAHPSEFIGVDEDYGEIDMSDEPSSAPLSQKDALAMMQAMNQGKSDDDDPVKNYYEIEKLKKLQRQPPSGAGKFSRVE